MVRAMLFFLLYSVNYYFFGVFHLKEQNFNLQVECNIVNNPSKSLSAQDLGARLDKYTEQASSLNVLNIQQPNYIAFNTKLCLLCVFPRAYGVVC